MPGGSFGATALLVAVQHANREMIDALLEAGGDINTRSHWWAGGFGVLDSEHGLTDFLIARGAVVNAHAAARLGRLDRLRELVSADPSLVHARGGDGQTPLHFSANVPVAAYLLEQGADIDAIDIDHESTPAQWMVSDRQEVARYLVSRGCRTDLLMVTALGDLPRVRAHLDADPGCIRMTVSETWFPKRNPQSGGTIYNWTLDSDATAHRIARRSGQAEVFALLLDRSPDDLKLAVACELADEALFRDLVARGSRLGASLSEEDQRKLPNAARDNNLASVRMFLAAGWPVNARGQHHGEAALHWAAFHGNPEMVRAVLEYGPDLELLDREYRGTALGWCQYGSQHGWHPERGDYGEALMLLRAAGATELREQ